MGDLVPCLCSPPPYDRGFEASLWKDSKDNRPVFEGNKRGSIFQEELQIEVIFRVIVKLLVRRQREIAMSESLNVLKTGGYEARTKGRLVTDLSEAVDIGKYGTLKTKLRNLYAKPQA